MIGGEEQQDLLLIPAIFIVLQLSTSWAAKLVGHSYVLIAPTMTKMGLREQTNRGTYRWRTTALKRTSAIQRPGTKKAELYQPPSVHQNIPSSRIFCSGRRHRHLFPPLRRAPTTQLAIAGPSFGLTREASDCATAHGTCSWSLMV